jgi:hypothetical protein
MSRVAARFVWKLARRHSWGSPIPADELVRLVAREEDHDELVRVLEDEVLDLPFVARSPDGIYVPNGQDAHVSVAGWLQAETDIDDLTIEATLSRLPGDWPRES